MSARKKIVIGNWKMNPQSILEAKKNFSTFKKIKKDDKGVTVVICPPFLYLNELKKSYTGNKIFFGSQDVFWKEEGSYTGEISTAMLKSVGIKFVIVGHSERRSLGENDMMIAQKLSAVLKSGMHAILCVGEGARDMSGKYLHVIRDQIISALQYVDDEDLNKLIIAYEPIWTIGVGHTAMDTHELYQMVLFIKKQLIEKHGRALADKISIIYGGSVDSVNTFEIIKSGGVDGLLVGRNSLNSYEFAKIISEVSRKK